MTVTTATTKDFWELKIFRNTGTTHLKLHLNCDHNKNF